MLHSHIQETKDIEMNEISKKILCPTSYNRAIALMIQYTVVASFSLVAPYAVRQGRFKQYSHVMKETKVTIKTPMAVIQVAENANTLFSITNPRQKGARFSPVVT